MVIYTYRNKKLHLIEIYDVTMVRTYKNNYFTLTNKGQKHNAFTHQAARLISEFLYTDLL